MTPYPDALPGDSAPLEKKRISCMSCARPIVVSFWDNLNGFLVICPYCRNLHGKSWNIKRLAIASLVFNALTFFFTIRPPRAVAVFLACVGSVALTGWAMADKHVPEPIEVGWFIIILLGPMIANAVLFVRHQSMIGKPA